MATCAFLGLGVMGGPWPAIFSQKGHSVTVWNRSPEKAAAWVEKGGEGDAAATARKPQLRTPNSSSCASVMILDVEAASTASNRR